MLWRKNVFIVLKHSVKNLTILNRTISITSSNNFIMTKLNDCLKPNLRITKCDKLFTNNCNMSTHLKLTHGEKPPTRVPCNLCSKTFLTKYLMKLHIITFHQGQRPFKCKLCSKSYTTNSDLNKHLKSIHYGVKYSCHICSTSLSSKASVNNHIRTVHQRLKPFVCHYCNKT